jgi:protein SCO1/2
MLCNMAMEGLVRSLRGLSLQPGQDFVVWTISFDPRERPELAAAAKRTALERYRAPGGEAERTNTANPEDAWHFLTGKEETIHELTGAVGFRYQYDPTLEQYAHPAGLVILSPAGTVARYLQGIQFPPTQLRLALHEASAGQVGSLADQVMLLCYNYDPARGKYGLAILRLLRLAGLATVLGLVGGIAWMLYRERAVREPRTS